MVKNVSHFNLFNKVPLTMLTAKQSMARAIARIICSRKDMCVVTCMIDDCVLIINQGNLLLAVGKNITRLTNCLDLKGFTH